MPERSKSPISRFVCPQCEKAPIDPEEQDFCGGCEAEMAADAERGLLT